VSLDRNGFPVVMVDPALVSITFTIECWRFIQEEARRWPALIPLPADVHALFDATPNIEISGAIPEPRTVVRMTLRQAQDTQRWLLTVHDDLKYDEQRRFKCLLCISRVAVAILFSGC
jgi:hypothetical protein